jgi:hypothetical protein
VTPPAASSEALTVSRLIHQLQVFPPDTPVRLALRPGVGEAAVPHRTAWLTATTTPATSTSPANSAVTAPEPGSRTTTVGAGSPGRSPEGLQDALSPPPTR